MPKLYSARQIVKALKRIGFEIVSQKGSHIKLRGIFDGETYTAIVPNHKEVALGTLQSILKQVGITREELEENI
ncbi:hypothetical protein A2893_01860 [Candidatus Woesebacteria bacterium RIFCSPLOWO2_01_FULL_39_25]|uniref:Addiction module toxin, HicA family n=1 Tax=Candidatus Woesebacteria bacterium RIFCSPLOWO2_01_FULL_39_25 TaxID=1802521 RepID=A0A1F8BK86_9BACT|nr:MAG: hypothetical protein A2893_01860 [Candidatus Woesebacteria bacterium RIFCSPLOWO2_01_FULL_39_25]